MPITVSLLHYYHYRSIIVCGFGARCSVRSCSESSVCGLRTAAFAFGFGIYSYHSADGRFSHWPVGIADWSIGEMNSVCWSGGVAVSARASVKTCNFARNYFFNSCKTLYFFVFFKTVYPSFFSGFESLRLRSFFLLWTNLTETEAVNK